MRPTKAIKSKFDVYMINWEAIKRLSASGRIGIVCLCANEPARRMPKDAAAFRAHHYTRDDTHTDTGHFECVRVHSAATHSL